MPSVDGANESIYIFYFDMFYPLDRETALLRLLRESGRRFERRRCIHRLDRTSKYTFICVYLFIF